MSESIVLAAMAFFAAVVAFFTSYLSKIRPRTDDNKNGAQTLTQLLTAHERSLKLLRLEHDNQIADIRSQLAECEKRHETLDTKYDSILEENRLLRIKLDEMREGT